MATTAAVSAAGMTFRRVYNDPGAAARSAANDDRLIDYRLLWAYYSNSVFETLEDWAVYRSRHRLYRHTRPIYNPARRLVEFYCGTIYQGEWADQPAAMIEKACAIPFGERTPAPLLQAIAQLYQWSNWQAKKSIMIRYAAAVGDCLVLLVDDMGRRKVYPEIVWPGDVAEVQLDATGNVVRYVLAYDVTDSHDPAGRTYQYRREVDKGEIVEYRDEAVTSRTPNPYTFVPACWVQHAPSGQEHGGPALRNLSKVDELNALAAHALDQAHRIFEAPIMLAGESLGSNLQAQPKAGPTGYTALPGRMGPAVGPGDAGREELKIITAGAGGDIKAVKLDPGEAIEHIDRLLKEIEADHPELGMWQSLRAMSQVTGPAADRLFGDVAALVNAARASYDQQTIKLLQMATAIAGWRANSGAWGLRSLLSRQQQAFLPFGLDSYANGELDLSIQSRGLVLPSPEDEIRLEQMRQALAADRNYLDGRGAAAGEGAGGAAGNTPAAIADRLRMAAQAQNGETVSA